jgi:ubiquinol-cytochrome c reductase cytochrome c1 subunit
LFLSFKKKTWRAYIGVLVHKVNSSWSTAVLANIFYHAFQGSLLLSSFHGKNGESSAGLKAFSLLGVGASGLMSFATIASADEAEHGLAAPDYPWPHAGIMSSYDHAS